MATSIAGVPFSAIGVGAAGLLTMYLGYSTLFGGGYRREGELKQAIVDIPENYDP